MEFNSTALGWSVTLLLIMTITPYVGFSIARPIDSAKNKQTASIELIMGALFALMGLLIAFTFSGAFARFEDRRQILVQEANDIGTAYQLLGLLDTEAQQELKPLFAQYTLSRARLFSLLNDPPAAYDELDHAETLQMSIWNGVIQATEGPQESQVRLLLLPALNDMIDITTTRTAAVLTHPPALLFITLCVVAVACSGLIGYSAGSMAKSKLSKAHTLGLAVTVAFVIYVILDVEYARYGFVTLANVNNLLVDMAESMATNSGQGP